MKGKRITGCADAEARKLGAEFVTGESFGRFAVREGNLITGQQQHSGEATAKLILEALEENV